MKKYYEVIDFSNSLYQVDQTIDAVIKAFGFELREISKYFPKVKAAVYQETHGDRCYEYAFPEEKALHFGLRTIVPIMIGLQIYDSAQLVDFIDGENYEPLMAVAHRADCRVFSCLLEHGESFNTKENPLGEIHLDERLKKVYYAIFGNALAGTKLFANWKAGIWRRYTREAVEGSRTIYKFFGLYSLMDGGLRRIYRSPLHLQ